ncbi:PRC-barrel domain-containing protein [Streptomyces sp. NBC_01198]|uniref:PRC-barrel domain-containing protein n=1 Tax=Streptomyces sp. NBC_01198 TaxID=2903769 RepID=UPI002E10B374|nr:PRC-barrel domain-containing protein [Streptomyces sp. NBC_01198]
MTDSMWAHQPAAGYNPGTDLAGFRVEATDGSIGKVDKHSVEVDSSYLVVDVGVWIFGKHVLLPAATISSIDLDRQTVFIALTKDEIKDAPEFDKDKHLTDPEHRAQTEHYYGRHRRV